jgi:hypothetical protein
MENRETVDRKGDRNGKKAERQEEDRLTSRLTEKMDEDRQAIRPTKRQKGKQRQEKIDRQEDRRRGGLKRRDRRKTIDRKAEYKTQKGLKHCHRNLEKREQKHRRMNTDRQEDRTQTDRKREHRQTGGFVSMLSGLSNIWIDFLYCIVQILESKFVTKQKIAHTFVLRIPLLRRKTEEEKHICFVSAYHELHGFLDSR